MKKKNKMETKHFIEGLKSSLRFMSLIAIMVFFVWSCKDDDEVGPTGPDMRLDGKELVVMLHVNPETGEEYTEEELAALEYDPKVEEYYNQNQKVKLEIWMQQKPEKIEVFNAASGEFVTSIVSFQRSDRPDLADYKEGYGYFGKWSTTTKEGDLNIPFDTSVTYDIKVTYFDVGIDGFQTASERSIPFTIHSYMSESIGSLADFLVGYWRFNNADDLGMATVGNDLVLGGAASHSAVAGVDVSDGASHLDIGTYYDVVDHGIADSYTMIWDVMVAAGDLGKYIPLWQNNAANDSDGAAYINPSAGFWFNGGTSDFSGTIKGDTWHRIAMSYESGEMLFYVDGIEIYSTTLSWDVDPSKFILFGENSSNAGNGEDNPISVTEFMLFDTAFSGTDLAGLPAVGTPAVDHITSNMAGRWTFNNTGNLLAAHTGNDLALGGAASHSAVAGSYSGDGAAYLDVGTWYDVDHGMQASLGSNVNRYSMIWDVQVAADDLDKYICLMQYNIANDSDGSFYINPSAGFWFNGGPSDFSGTIKPDQWHRIAMSVDAPIVTVYVDNVEIYVGESLADVDGKFSLDLTKFIILGENSSNDGNGEDNPISISDFMVFERPMTADEMIALPPVSQSAF